MIKSTVKTLALVTTLSVTGLLVGCSDSADAPQAGADAPDVSPDVSYVAASEPAGSMPVGEARESTEDTEAVTLTGVIGGSREPFVDGIAAFTVVDPKIPSCQAEEGCPTPWDYCCAQDQVKDNIATIKVVDENGNPVTQDARELLGVEELATVVVQGKAQRDEQGNLSVLADQVFVK